MVSSYLHGHREPLACISSSSGPGSTTTSSKRHPALRPREEKPVLCRPSRHRPTLRHHLLARRLLPAPQQGPLAYLRDVLIRLPTMTNQQDSGALTLARWTPAGSYPDWIDYHYGPTTRHPAGRLQPVVVLPYFKSESLLRIGISSTCT